MTAIDPNAVPVRREGASLSRLSPVEGVMVAFDAGVYVRLNESAMLVWDLIDGQRSVNDIAGRFAARFVLAPVTALDDTRECLQRFAELQVIDV
jgi:hypothetical protein